MRRDLFDHEVRCQFLPNDNARFTLDQYNPAVQPYALLTLQYQAWLEGAQLVFAPSASTLEV